MKITRSNKVEKFIKSNEYVDTVIEAAFNNVQVPESLVASATEVTSGSEFTIDLVVPEGVETGDKRIFEVGSLTARDLPVPILWQIKTGTGHDGSVVVGRIDYVERVSPIPSVEDGDISAEDVGAIGYHGLGNARGVFDTGPYGREAERLVRGRFLRGISADLDKFEAEAETIDAAVEEEGESSKRKISNEIVTISQARLTAVTIVAKPSFQECEIKLVEPYEEELYMPIDDGLYEEEYDSEDMMIAAMTASAAPVIPPKTWFLSPGLKGPTPITVTDEGQVFGHIAAWNVNHIGYAGPQKPPRSRSNYAYFRTGVLRVDDGSDIPVGQLTLAGGHASMQASAKDAVKHYDDTASAMADVTIGEDAFGIWVAGALRPSATAEQVRALRASAPSGDWRPINGKLELVAVCQVNVPGFPVARSMVAGGQIMALVAAGARPIAELRNNHVEERLAELETIEFNRKKKEAQERIAPLAASRAEALVASAEAARSRLAPEIEKRKEKETLAYNEAKSRLLSLGILEN